MRERRSRAWKRRLGASLLVGLALGTFLPISVLAANSTSAEAVRSSQTPHIERRPNIILILADDLGVEGINSYGGEYHTPNLDRMAREGMRFDNAHAMPLCTPSRVRIMTGQESHRNYQAFGYLAPGQTTFGNLLKDAGYATGIVGKWQLSGNGFDGRSGITPQQAGFDESFLWQLKALDAKGSRYWGPTRVVNGRTDISEDGFGPDADNAFALDFIERHKDQPFFLYYPMVLVHNPFVPTPASLDATDSKERFGGMISYMDRKIGQLFDRLKSLGIDSDTVVIFAGDNGTNRQITSYRNGHSIRGGKATPTVNGTHVPLIVRGPGIVQAGQVTQGLFDFTDVLPTLADLARTKPGPGPLDGVSQVPVLRGGSDPVRNSIFMHYDPRWGAEPARFVFDAHWKLYGDGRFVSVDSISGIETELPVASLRGEASRRHAAFQKILRETRDGPFDPNRYPMCVGKPSRDPSRPAIQAGCKSVGGDS